MSDIVADMLKAIRDVDAKLGPAPRSPFDSLFRASWPLYTDTKLPEDRMFLFSRPPALFVHPRHYATVASMVVGGDEGIEELRCGPYSSPNGSQWAVVMDAQTRRRKVVDWPQPYPDLVRPRRVS